MIFKGTEKMKRNVLPYLDNQTLKSKGKETTVAASYLDELYKEND